MSSKQASVRIIAGEHRGRRLPVLDSPGLRPTKDAIRETLFNWLAPSLPNARCLDLFSGSGALGFEAASRHAKEVVLVEKERDVAQQLLSNVTLLGQKNIQVHASSAEKFIEKHEQGGAAFDVVFLDPPFEMHNLNEIVDTLINQGLVANDSVIYIEQDKRLGLPMLPPGWMYHREKKMGEVVYGLAHFNSE